MTGEQTGEDISEERDEGAIWEIVDREFVGEEFRCPTCELTLMGSDEIDAAGLNYIHEDLRHGHAMPVSPSPQRRRDQIPTRTVDAPGVQSLPTESKRDFLRPLGTRPHRD
jgi:hypothetical protein